MYEISTVFQIAPDYIMACNWAELYRENEGAILIKINL
jgi:hypothetical protein